jgi:hypothetical protein
MGAVNLSRLWYIFPPDDQDLRPGQFERKVTSFINYLPRDQQIAVLDFLMVQYAAFQKQLEVLRARAVVSQPEHSSAQSGCLIIWRPCESVGGRCIPTEWYRPR